MRYSYSIRRSRCVQIFLQTPVVAPEQRRRFSESNSSGTQSILSFLLVTWSPIYVYLVCRLGFLDVAKPPTKNEARPTSNPKHFLTCCTTDEIGTKSPRPLQRDDHRHHGPDAAGKISGWRVLRLQHRHDSTRYSK